MPSSTAGALSIRPKLAGSASGLAGSLTVAGGAVISSITGAILTEKNAAYATLGVMLFSSLTALFAALYVLWADHCESRAKPG